MWDEFRDHTRAVETLRPYLLDYLALKADALAVAEVEAEVAAEMNRLMTQGIPSVPDTVEAQSQAQRRVTNYLGAASAFRDRACRRLSGHLGEEAKEAFSARMSQHFDSALGYRVLYYLRNYAQHYENPLSLVQTQGLRDSEGTMLATITLELHTEDFSKSKVVKASVRKELADLGCPKLHLTPMIAENVEHLADAFALIVELHRAEIIKMAQYGAVLFREMEIPAGCQPVIFEGPEPEKNDFRPRRMIMAGFDELERLMNLHRSIRGTDAF